MWSAEIKDLKTLYLTCKGQHARLDKELDKLIVTEDENMALVYSRRCLEVIITDLCETELNRGRGTEPLKGIIDKLNKEEKVPHNIIVSMQNLNSLSSFGAHPKDFDPRQVKPVLLDLITVLEWYLKHLGTREAGEVVQDQFLQKEAGPVGVKKASRKKILLVSGILLASAIIIVSLIVFDVIGGGNKTLKDPIESIVVLPFDNYTGDEKLDNMVSSMHSLLINDIGRISGLRVISKTSAKKFKESNLSATDIAKELNVDAVVEASVGCLGDNVCMQFRLISARGEEEQLWNANYQEEKNQLLNLFDQITQTIADEVRIELTEKEQELLAINRTIDRDAVDVFLKGYAYLDDLSETSLYKALEFLKQAIEIDSTWAAPYASLTLVWGGMAQMGYATPDIAGPKIFENLNKALLLDPTLPELNFTVAGIAVWTEWDWEKGEQAFLRAIAVNPNDAQSRMYYAHLLMILNRKDEALMQAELATEIDPMNPLILSLHAAVLIGGGDFQFAVNQCEKALSIDPGNFFVMNILEYAYYHNGDYPKSIKQILNAMPELNEQEKKEIETTLNSRDYYAAIEMILEKKERIAAEGYISPADLGEFYTRIKNYNRALELYEKGFELHDPNMPYLRTAIYGYDELKNEPRFIELLKKMNLPLDEN